MGWLNACGVIALFSAGLCEELGKQEVAAVPWQPRVLQSSTPPLCSSAMLMAARYGDMEQLELSLQLEPPSCTDELQRTPLHFAAEYNQVNASLLLLAAGALMDRDVRGRVPLHSAASAGHVPVTSLLLQSGAYIELGDDGQRTPLHLAAFKGHTEVVRLMLDRDANIDALDGDRRIPLHYTTRSDVFLNTTLLLIERGADLEKPDILGFRPLHVACHEAQPRTAEYLLGIGADLYALDVQGWNPLVHAAAGEPQELYKDLVYSIIATVLKPRKFPEADPKMFKYVEQDPNAGLILGINSALVALMVTAICGGSIACSMFCLFRRLANQRKPYLVSSDDKAIEKFIDEIFDDLVNANETPKKLFDEWDNIPMHTLNDLHRVKH